MKQYVFLLKTCILSIMLAILPTVSYSMTNEKEIIPLNSDWDTSGTPSARSLFSPFTAYHDASTVTIYNNKPAWDLTITITDTESGAEVYSLEVSAESSSYIVLLVSGLGSGNYCLTISHPEAGYVYGYFNL